MKRILFVHDSQEDPRTRISYLEARGYVVEAVRNGDQALASIERDKPTVVMLDVLLDGPNGFEVCRAIRSRFGVDELPILMCSGIYRSRIYKDAARDAGAQSYLVRPFALDQMVDQIEQVLVEQIPTPRADTLKK
jgi:twitching motility two-component system response regulator PilH